MISLNDTVSEPKFVVVQIYSTLHMTEDVEVDERSFLVPRSVEENRFRRPDSDRPPATSSSLRFYARLMVYLHYLLVFFGHFDGRVRDRIRSSGTSGVLESRAQKKLIDGVCVPRQKRSSFGRRSRS